MSAHRFCRIVRLLVLLAAFCLAGVGCSTPDPVTGRSTLNAYSLEEDIELGRSALRANTESMEKAGVPINRDREKVVQLNEMMDRITAVSDLPDLPYTVTLYHTNLVNAAAAPGGSLMVFEGLYDPEIGLVRDTDELAAVMAHEVAHVTCRHVTERLTKAKTTDVVSQTIGIAAQIMGYGDVYGVARDVFVVSSALILPAYSRKDEAEADRVGLTYMAKAGYDPRAALRIWRRAAQDKGSHSALSIFSTHPANRNRYRELEPLLPAAMEEYRAATGAYPAGYVPKRRRTGG